MVDYVNDSSYDTNNIELINNTSGVSYMYVFWLVDAYTLIPCSRCRNLMFIVIIFINTC